MTRQFIAADMRTGRVGPSLPSLDVQWPLRRSLSNYDTTTATLNLSGAPRNWAQAIREGATVIACYDDATLPDGTTPRAIEWAGYVTALTPKGSADQVDLSLVTLEGYLNRRYAGAGVYATSGWRAIIADQVTNHVKTTLTEPGIDLLRMSYTGDGTIPPVPLTWADGDNAKVLSRMNDLTNAYGGEFTIEWAWSTDGMTLVPTLVMGDRIGYHATSGLPPVTFTYPGVVVDAQQVRDYSEGNGANKVQAFSSAATLTNPVYLPFDGRPTFEARVSPKVQTDDPGALAAYAQKAAVVLGPGLRPVTMTISTSDTAVQTGRRLNVDWRLGDDVGYVIGGPDADGNETVPAFPGGLFGIGRVVAYEIAESTINPIFAQSDIYGSAV